jgi:flagellar basal-body rod protein FlgB
MLNSLFDTASIQAARAALSGLSRRQEAVAGNVANIDTVGYQRRSVNFEDALASRLSASSGVMRTSDPRHISRAGATGNTQSSIETRDVVSTRNDRNNVSIDEEMSLMVETQLRYQALTQTLGRRIGTLRTVIRG